MTATETKILTAAFLGGIAFKAGMRRIPAMDKRLLSLLAGNQIGEGIPILGAWLKSWDAANLCTAL